MTLKELIEQGIASIALLPEMNDFLLSQEGQRLRQEILTNPPEKLGQLVNERFHKLPPQERQRYLDLRRLESLTAYTVPLIDGHYAAKTPIMYAKSGESVLGNCKPFSISLLLNLN